MSYTFEVAIIKPRIKAVTLQKCLADSIAGTGWMQSAEDVVFLASRIGSDAILIEHRATRSSESSVTIRNIKPSVTPFRKRSLRLQHFYVELGCRLAESGCRTIATITSDQVGEWAVYALDADTIAAYRRRSLVRRFFNPDLPDFLCEFGEFHSQSSSNAQAWLSTALNHSAFETMWQFHLWMIESSVDTLAEWRDRLVFPPLRLVRNGIILCEPEELAIEFLRDEVLE